MGAFARMQRHLFRVNGVRMRLTSTLAVTYAANAVSLSLPIAGPPASVGYAYTQFRRLGADSATTSWTLGISWVVSTFTLGVVLAVGALTSGNTTTAVIGLASAVVAIVPLVAVLVALRNSSGAGRRRDDSPCRRGPWSGVSADARLTSGPRPYPVDAFLDDLATVRMSAVLLRPRGVALPLELVRPTPSAWSSPSSPPAGPSPGTVLLLAYAVGTGAALLPAHSRWGRRGGARPGRRARHRRHARPPRPGRRARVPDHQLLAGHRHRVGDRRRPLPLEPDRSRWR